MATTSRIADILLKAGLIDQLQLRSAIAHQDQWGGRLANIVVEKRFTREPDVVEALSRALDVPRHELASLERDAAALQKLDPVFCKEHAVFPVALDDGGKTLMLAMADPTDIMVVDRIQARTRLRIRTFVAGEGEIGAAIEKHYYGREPAPALGFAGAVVRVEEMEPDEDEFKIVDITGKTVMKRLADIKPDEPTNPPPVAPPSAAPPIRSALDDLLAGDLPPTSTPWTAADLQRLEAIRSNQEKGSIVLRALLELCFEKGLFSRDEYLSRYKP